MYKTVLHKHGFHICVYCEKSTIYNKKMMFFTLSFPLLPLASAYPLPPIEDKEPYKSATCNELSRESITEVTLCFFRL